MWRKWQFWQNRQQLRSKTVMQMRQVRQNPNRGGRLTGGRLKGVRIIFSRNFRPKKADVPSSACTRVQALPDYLNS